MPDLIDSKSAIKSVQKDLVSDQLRWKSLVYSVSAGEPMPPSQVVIRLGQAWDFSPNDSTSLFLHDIECLRKHRQLLKQLANGERTMSDWQKKHESPEALKAELLTVQKRSVEIRTQLSKHWQRDTGNCKTHWQIQKLENDNRRVFD